MDLKEYRMVEGIGNYWNRRWEIQEKYKYFENGEWIEAWHMIFWSSDKARCEEVFEKYKKLGGKRNETESGLLLH